MKRSLMSITLCVMILFGSSAFAQYQFTGNGSWTDPANWQGGLVPPSTIPSNTTVIVYGNAYNCDAFNPTQCASTNLGGNNGNIIIKAGGSLTVQNSTQFSNGGAVIVYGTLVNKTTWEAYNTSSIIVYGTFNNEKWIGNQGYLTVDSGTVVNTGTLDNTFLYPGQIIVRNHGSISNVSPSILKLGNITYQGRFMNSGQISGSPTITGDVTNSGALSPGYSPGIFTIQGDYAATPTAVHIIEVAGTVSNQYDQVKVGGTATLDGTLNVSLLSGFAPTTAHDLPIITGTISGTFSSANLPAGYALVYNSNSVVLRYSAALPVFFMGLSVKAVDGNTTLMWTVAQEHLVDHYEVEKSLDGITFRKIADQPAKGQENYTLIDPQTAPNSFYRVKSVDLDGKYQYSRVIALSLSNDPRQQLKVYPNPGSGDVTLQYDALEEGRVDIQIIDVTGRVLLQKSISVQKGRNLFSINALVRLGPGHYIIQVKRGASALSSSFVVSP